jgi:hypothetical protein
LFGPDFWREDDFGKVAERAENAIKQLSSDVLNAKKPRPGPYTFFSHNAHALKRVQDVRRVLKRMASLRRRLVHLDAEFDRRKPKDWPGGVPYPEEIKAIMKASNEVNGYLEMDFEALYFYGGILLDQLAALACHVGGLDKVLWFSRLIQRFEKEPGDASFPTILETLWTKQRQPLLRHYASFKIFRDKFIVHHDLPWQRGTGRDMTNGEFVLNSFLSPGWLSEEQEGEAAAELMSILDDAPEWLKSAATSWNWMQLVPELLKNVDQFDESTRKRIHKVALKFGFSSATYHDIGEQLLNLSADFAEELVAIANADMNRVQLQMSESATTS